MDTQSLIAFTTVADLQSFSAAAEKLHLTQPAVSKRIASLEAQLDCRLFDRIARNIQLTEAGLALYPKAQQILQDVAEAERSVRELQGKVAGSLSIGISHHIGLHRLPPVLQAFSKRYPQVRLDINFMDSEEAHELVSHGRLDLAVITLSPDTRSELFHEAIWRDQLVFVTANDHPLAMQKNVSLPALSEFTAILPGLNTYTGQIVAALFKQHTLKLDVSMETNYLETIKMMVSIGLGWSVLPSNMLFNDLAIIDLQNVELHRDLGYLHHPGRSLSNAAKAFVQELSRNKDPVLTTPSKSHNKSCNC
jgi:DNA-binding transcriptional LysR family regulator